MSILPPTIGAGLLIANSDNGWQPRTLLLPSPVVTLRYNDGATHLFTPRSAEPFLTISKNPVDVLDDVLTAIRRHLPAAGPMSGKPAFPVALIAASYEFGRVFHPHERAFPHFAQQTDDDFFASIHLDAYRPHASGAPERIGYAGSIPADWLPGAPALQNGPATTHEPPPISPFPHNCDQNHPLVSQLSKTDYTDAVRSIHDLLKSGDTYQVNLTVPLRGSTSASPEQLFDAALYRGGASYAGMMLLPAGTLLSLSPELYLRRRGAVIETRPIKGTRRIGPDGLEAARSALLASAKDRAEHVMIVDLERNDLGRICTNGSVTVDPFLRIVEHPLLLHMESTVSGTLRPGTTLREIFEATFPGGSITGAPKKRALEIIGSLEQSPRGVYCGAFGWIDASGDCELNLPIRTAMARPNGTIEYHSGGGIVADSTAGDEWNELLHKAEFMSQILKDVARPG
ncbi:anthranilate synthase component I family protein [Candidatus Sumerlaeota bacterium]|nr:anthranilate synthase component I family protein [Candidatus Sumerlaeota bacterium]